MNASSSGCVSTLPCRLFIAPIMPLPDLQPYTEAYGVQDAWLVQSLTGSPGLSLVSTSSCRFLNPSNSTLTLIGHFDPGNFVWNDGPEVKHL